MWFEMFSHNRGSLNSTFSLSLLIFASFMLGELEFQFFTVTIVVFFSQLFGHTIGHSSYQNIYRSLLGLEPERARKYFRIHIILSIIVFLPLCVFLIFKDCFYVFYRFFIQHKDNGADFDYDEVTLAIALCTVLTFSIKKTQIGAMRSIQTWEMNDPVLNQINIIAYFVINSVVIIIFGFILGCGLKGVWFAQIAQDIWLIICYQGLYLCEDDIPRPF